MDENTNFIQNSVLDPAHHLSHAKKLASHLSTLMKTADEESIKNGEVSKIRNRLFFHCNALIEDSKFRRTALYILWFYCFSSPIKYFISFRDLEPDEKRWLRCFTAQCASKLVSYVEKYSDSRMTLFLHIGDLYRYSIEFNEGDERERDLSTAIGCFKKAFIADSTQGQPFNQSALLYRKLNPWKSIIHFLRALISLKPFYPAFDNLLNTTNSEFKGFFQTISQIVNLTLDNFERSAFDLLRRKLDEDVKNLLSKAMLFDVMECIYPISLLSIYLLNQEGGDERWRIVLFTVFDIWSTLINEFKQHNSKPEKDRQRRRRRSPSPGEHDDNDNSKDEYGDSPRSTESGDGEDDDEEFHPNRIVLATIISEFFLLSGEALFMKKVPVSLRMQYRSTLTLLIDFLNNYLTQLSPIISSTTRLESKQLLTKWYFDAPRLKHLSNSNLIILLCFFISKCIESKNVPICFDRYFKIAENSAGEEELKKVSAVSNLHAQHCSLIQENERKIPVYVMPSTKVLLSYIPLIEYLLNSTRLAVIIPRCALYKLDKLKKENACSRESIRWLETSIQKGRIKMPNSKKKQNLFEEAVSFLDSKGLLNREALFLTILTTNEDEIISVDDSQQCPASKDEIIDDNNSQRYPANEKEIVVREESKKYLFSAISIENINEFSRRIAACVSSSGVT